MDWPSDLDPNAIAPPDVVPALSECSRYIEVTNLFEGAFVEIVTAQPATFTLTGTATGPTSLFPLGNNQRLQPYQAVVARQTHPKGTKASDFGRPTVALPLPAQLRPLALLETLYACASCVRLTGAFPGAVVTLTANGAPLGGVVAVGGSIRIGLIRPLSRNDVVRVTQSCGQLSSPSLPMPSPAPLPSDWATKKDYKPEIKPPLRACERVLPIDKITPGATVRVRGLSLGMGAGNQMRGQIAPAVCVELSNCGLPVPPLVAGAWITIEEFFGTPPHSDNDFDQPFAECPDGGPGVVLESDSIQVLPAFTPAPAVCDPVCHGKSRVRIINCSKTAVVQMAWGSDDYDDRGPFTPFVSTSAKDFTIEVDIVIPPLAAFIVARQWLCKEAGWSDWSAPAFVENRAPSTPELVGPLLRRGLAVRVRNITPGSNLEVKSLLGNGTYGRTVADDDEIDVPLNVALQDNDRVYVTAELCGSADSNVELVQQVPAHLGGPIAPPQIVMPLDDCLMAVKVTGVYPGAIVHLWIVTPPQTQPAWFASATITRDTGWAPIPRLLSLGEQIIVRQEIDGQWSTASPAATMTMPLPAAAWVPESTNKIAQLTGDHEPDGRATLNRTTRWGLVGVDYGYSFEHDDGRLYFTFGDAGGGEGNSFLAQAGEGNWWDPIGFTDDIWVGSRGIRLRFVEDPNSPPLSPAYRRRFKPFTVSGHGTLPAGQIPHSGFSWSGRMYVHCGVAESYGKYGSESCGAFYDTNSRQNLRTTQFMVVTDDPATDFEVVKTVPHGVEPWCRFLGTSSVIIRNADYLAHLPPNASVYTYGLLIYGGAANNVHLLWAPLSPGMAPNQNEFWYFRELTAQGPVWVQNDPDAAGLLLTDVVDFAAYKDVASWPSVQFYPELGRWLMLYNRAVMKQGPPPSSPDTDVGPGNGIYPGRIVARVAREPWGPWSAETPIFETHTYNMSQLRPFGAYRDFMHMTDSRSDDRAVMLPHDDLDRQLFFEYRGAQRSTNVLARWNERAFWAWPYASYLLGRFRRANYATGSVRIYFTMSVGNPYQVMLMTSKIRCE